MSHTPGPWMLGEFDEQGGYDCMTSGIQCGPANLDGHTYGEEYRTPLPDAAKKQMMADARLIAAAPELLAALQDMLAGWKYIRSFHGDLYGVGWDRAQKAADAAIAKATGADK